MIHIGRGSLVLSLAAAIGVICSVPAPARAGSLAVGGGQTAAAGRDFMQFAFSARHGHVGLNDANGDPNGSSGEAVGYILLNWPPPGGNGLPTDFLFAEVICLLVEANEGGTIAQVLGLVTRTMNPDVPFTPDVVRIVVEDSGSFGDGDSFFVQFGKIAGPGPLECPTSLLPGTGDPLTFGNITVISNGNGFED